MNVGRLSRIQFAVKYFSGFKNPPDEIAHFSVYSFSFFLLDSLHAVMVFCYQNCSDLTGEKIVLLIETVFLKFKPEG